MDDSALIQALGQYNAGMASDRGFKAAGDYQTQLADLYNKRTMNQFLPQQQQAELGFKQAQTGYQNALARGQNVKSDLESNPAYVQSTLDTMRGTADQSKAKGDLAQATLPFDKFLEITKRANEGTQQVYNYAINAIGQGKDPAMVAQEIVAAMPQDEQHKQNLDQVLAIGQKYAGNPQGAMQYLQQQSAALAKTMMNADPKAQLEMWKTTQDNLARIQAAAASRAASGTSYSSLGKTAMMIAHSAGRDTPNEEDWNRAAQLTAQASPTGQPTSQTAAVTMTNPKTNQQIPLLSTTTTKSGVGGTGSPGVNNDPLGIR